MSTTTSHDDNFPIFQPLLQADCVRFALLNFLPLQRNILSFFVAFSSKNYFKRRFGILDEKIITTIHNNSHDSGPCLETLIFFYGAVKVLLNAEFFTVLLQQKMKAESHLLHFWFHDALVYIDFLGKPRIIMKTEVSQQIGDNFPRRITQFFRNYCFTKCNLFEFDENQRYVCCKRNQAEVAKVGFEHDFQPHLLSAALFIRCFEFVLYFIWISSKHAICTFIVHRNSSYLNYHFLFCDVELDDRSKMDLY